MYEVDNTIKEIKAKVDIVDLASRYIELKNAGKNYTCRCPFHNEKTPSFSISPELQMYKCFGCGKSGDIFTFLMEIEHIEFKEAKEKLAKIAGVEIKNNKPQNYLNILNNLAVEIYHKNLFENAKAKEYLKSRGFIETDVRKFKIGYSRNDNQLISVVRKKYKYTSNQLLNSGLFVIRNNQLIDKFKNRIMFPIYDQHSTVIGFTARQMPDNTFGPKYLNTPETEIFKKSFNIYGLNWAKYSIKKEDLCIVCEGTTDIISAHRSGIEHIVAPLGTSLTKQQLQIIKQYTSNVLFIFDDDNAGYNALIRAFGIAQELDMIPFAQDPTPYHDVDELCKNSPELIKEKIDKRIDAFSFIISKELKNLNLSRLTDKQKITKLIDTLVGLTKNQELIEYYIKRASEIIGEDIYSTKNRQSKDIKTYNSQSVTRKTPQNDEITLFRIILENQNLVKSIDISHIRNEAINQVLALIKQGAISIQELHEKLNAQQRDILEKTLLLPMKYNEKDFNFIYNKLRKENYSLQRQEKRKLLGIAQEENNEKELERLQQEIFELDKLIQSI